MIIATAFAIAIQFKMFVKAININTNKNVQAESITHAAMLLISV